MSCAEVIGLLSLIAVIAFGCIKIGKAQKNNRQP